MKTNYIYALAVIVIIIIGGFLYFNKNKVQEINNDNNNPAQSTTTSPLNTSKTNKPSVNKPSTSNPNTGSIPSGQGQAPVQNIPTAASLNGLIFRMTTYNGTTLSQDIRYTMTFDNGKLSAKLCNSMSGNFVLDGSLLKVSNFLSTLMACTTPSNAMKIESDFVSMLNSGATIYNYKTGNSIILSHPNGTVMAFTGF